jgi:haloalkane dehalogenase
VAELPRQLVAATPLLAELEVAVPAKLGNRPALITYPMRDIAFRPAETLPRLRAAFEDVEVVELPEAGHYFVEDAPDEVAAAVVARFG